MKTRIGRSTRILLTVSLLSFIFPGIAYAGGLKMKLRGRALAGFKAVALSRDGTVLKTGTVGSSNRVSFSSISGPFSVQFVDDSNRYAGAAVTICSAALRKAGCRLKPSKLGVGFSGRRNVGSMNFKWNEDGFFKSTISNSLSLSRLKRDMTAKALNGKPLGTASNLGRLTGIGTSVNSANRADGNRDGVPDVYAADDDGDGIIDNYDSQDNNPAGATSLAATAAEVRVFSNLKLEIGQSLNANTGTTPTSTEIDTALSSAGTLAIAVVGDAAAGDVTELDCGALNYCKTGGTGRKVEGGTSFPDASDADGDGLGEIAAGSTGDFQLQHGASSSQITAGDTFLEVVTETTSAETKVPGMLNFVFNTTPALKTLEVQGRAPYTVNYPASPSMQGSANNCFSVPATGDLVLTFTAWRPQRPGNATLGEASFVDIGKARYVIDIPNLPCLGSGGCSGAGPGNCDTIYFSTADPNLSAATNGEGLQDSKSDADADTGNTVQFTLDLTGCLGSTPFSSGEKLFLDLQAVSGYGDNAAQKFCIQRE